MVVILEIGDIVLCDYIDINGVKKEGLFCIGYTERYDMTQGVAGNVMACKITSQLNTMYNYYVDLPKDTLSCLSKDSRICASKTYIFKEEDVKRVIGKLTLPQLLQFQNAQMCYDNSIKEQMAYRINKTIKERCLVHA